MTSYIVKDWYAIRKDRPVDQPVIDLTNKEMIKAYEENIKARREAMQQSINRYEA